MDNNVSRWPTSPHKSKQKGSTSWKQTQIKLLSIKGAKCEMTHNIIKIHNNVMWDWQCFVEYSPNLD